MNIHLLSKGPFAEFKHISSSWREVFKWKDSTFIAIKKLGGINLLAGRISFSPIKPLVSPLAIETKSIIATRFFEEVGKDTLDECLDDSIEGRIKISGKEGKLFQKGTDPIIATYLRVSASQPIAGLRIPSLIHSGSSKIDLLAEGEPLSEEVLGDELRGSDQPFDGFDDLLTYFGFPVFLHLPQNCFLEVILYSPGIILADSKIIGGSANIKCVLVKTAEPKKMKFGYKTIFKDGVKRGNIEGGDFSWKEEDFNLSGTTTVNINDATFMQGFLSYAGIPVHQWWIDNPEKRANLRHALHSMQDQELIHIKKFLLADEGGKNRSFEHGVAWLLNILGFSVAHFGNLSNMQDGPDIIAVTPQNNVAIVECTIGLLDRNNKLSKLVERTTSITEGLKASGNGYCKVQSVIVTAFSKTKVEADLPKAGENGIAVFCKEDIETLLNYKVMLPQNADTFFQELQQYIPLVKQVPPILEPLS